MDMGTSPMWLHVCPNIYLFFYTLVHEHKLLSLLGMKTPKLLSN